MTITLKKCLSDNRVIGKTFSSEEGDVMNFTAVIKGECSIMDPVVELTQAVNTADITSFNYMEIPDFNRKYFIVSIKHIANGIWQISAHIDVLETYATEIKNAPIFVDTRERSGNYYIDDKSVTFEDRTIEQVLMFKGDVDNEWDPDTGDLIKQGDNAVDDDGNCWFDYNEWNLILITQGPGSTVAPTP